MLLIIIQQEKEEELEAMKIEQAHKYYEKKIRSI